MFTGPKFDVTIPLLHIHGMLITCVVLCGIMPLFYPLTLLVLTFVYMFNKYLILNFYQKSVDFNEHLIVNANRYVFPAIICHFMVTLGALLRSPSLRSASWFSSANFENDLTKENLKTLNIQDDSSSSSSFFSTEAEGYVDYLIVLILLYIFNLLVINPITCFIQEGCFFITMPKLRRPTALSSVKNSEARDSSRRNNVKYLQQKSISLGSHSVVQQSDAK